MRTILHLIGTTDVGGGGEHLLQLTPRLRTFGYSSVVACGHSGPAAGRLERSGVPVRVIGNLGVWGPRRAAAVIREIPHDLLHCHGSRAAFAAAVSRRVDRAVPMVYTAHIFSFRRRALPPVRWGFAYADRLSCARAARVICLTRFDVRAAEGVGINTAHFVVVPNGITATEFNQVPDRRSELGIPAGAPVAGLIARFSSPKDPVLFVRVAVEVARILPGAHFVLVGDGPLRADVEAAAREGNLGDRLHLAGFRSDVPNLLATMDVFVLTSAWEAQPLAVLEAMSARRPVVAPYLPGLDEVIVDGVTGVLVPSRRPEAIAMVTAELLSDPVRRGHIGAAGRRRIDDRFTADRMAEGTARIYDEVLETAHRG